MIPPVLTLFLGHYLSSARPADAGSKQKEEVMSTFLPPVPSIEHLKKQAKDLLKAFRRNDPKVTETFATLQLKSAPKLADAQHLIAKKYGFQTWAELKLHAAATAQISDDVIQEAREAFQRDDARSFRRILEQYPVLK